MCRMSAAATTTCRRPTDRPGRCGVVTGLWGRLLPLMVAVFVLVSGCATSSGGGSAVTSVAVPGGSSTTGRATSSSSPSLSPTPTATGGTALVGEGAVPAVWVGVRVDGDERVVVRVDDGGGETVVGRWAGEIAESGELIDASDIEVADAAGVVLVGRCCEPT